MTNHQTNHPKWINASLANSSRPSSVARSHSEELSPLESSSPALQIMNPALLIAKLTRLSSGRGLSYMTKGAKAKEFDISPRPGSIGRSETYQRSFTTNRSSEMIWSWIKSAVSSSSGTFFDRRVFLHGWTNSLPHKQSRRQEVLEQRCFVHM